MKRRVCALLLSAILVMTLFLSTSATGGSTSDPVVSKSYVDVTFFKSVIASAAEKIESWASSLKTKYFGKAQDAIGEVAFREELSDFVAEAVLCRLQSEGKYLYSSKSMSPITLHSGDVISGKPGTMIMVMEGTSKCTSGSLINITQGSEASAGSAIGRFTTYMFPENGGVVEITSNRAKVLVDGVYSRTTGGHIPKYTEEAYALKALGLVRGASNGMELYRGNTRAESITMLIRLLGEEKASLSGTHNHPFTDVDTWAQGYVGYAYRMGYTKGVSNTRYDGSSLTTANQYLTFVLRSLGYREDAGDFKYESAVSDAVRLGVIPQSFADELSRVEFKRDHVMHISYLAMSARIKGGSMTLLEKLVANGAVEKADADKFMQR